MLDRSAWLFEPAADATAQARLICFPPAGAGPAMFRTWNAGLPAGVAVAGVRLPGRESRWSDAPYGDWQHLIADVVAAIAPLLDVPYVLYGHSFGGSVAYEVARALQLLRWPAPHSLVLSACRAPELEPHTLVPWDASSDALWTWVAAMNGTPAQILTDAALRTALEPTLRADLKLAHRWRNRPDVRLEAPIVTFGAAADAVVPPQHVAGWAGYTARDHRHVAFPGGHFFVREYESDVLEELARICRDLQAGVPC